MEELYIFQQNLISQISLDWKRYLFSEIKGDEKLLGIKGIRGVGKTTLLLQYLISSPLNPTQKLYVTADHPYFYQNSLFELASQFYSVSGQLLLIDEVHKYKNWSRELKLIYDGFPNLKVIFTSSSALDLYRGESDLSRRLITQNLEGLSFREYLRLTQKLDLPSFPLEELITNHLEIASTLLSKFHAIPNFKNYLNYGYFPIVNQVTPESVSSRVFQIINTVLESDLAFAKEYSPSNIAKIKKLLGVISVSVPFEPNISKIAEKLGLGRTTVYSFLAHLQDAKLIRMINKQNRGINYLQKPDKIYFENTNFAFALQSQPNSGTIRETFFANQLSNTGHKLELSTKGDFLIDQTWTVEIGGKSKDGEQIKGVENSFLALDELEIGFDKKIPLWLFGFLY
ncbi:AAA family ATPase [Algoriphagus sp. AGSA1]|uniref:ATP-binding protein n=1 Tax=Algoriphagus sp. AGSA1 TaxID=2907213 RepID=UPI001F24FFDB|nr:AAA family ATPase [Algoriphagus sp. AGSA1]MCE7053164.1 AAA family ATPase [Algoriphagus sp. AGSA1]